MSPTLSLGLVFIIHVCASAISEMYMKENILTLLVVDSLVSSYPHRL